MDELKLEFGLDYFQILEQDDDCMLVNLDLLHLGKNRNMCDISKECVEKSLPTFFNKPIIYRLNSKYYPQSSTDVVEHARSDEEEKLMYIAGTIPESSPVQYIERNKKTYLRMAGVIHKHYQPILMRILKNRNGEMKVSIEIKAKGQKNEEGIFVIDHFIFMAVCLLAKDVQEGIEGSEMVVTKFSLEDYNSHYLSFANKLNNTEDTYKIPQNVKDNAKKGLDLRKEYGRGGTSVGINMAKYITKTEYATFEKVNKISQYFPRHANDNLDEKDPPSNGYIAWLLWGADEGWKWSKGIVDRKEKEGDKMDNSLEVFIAKEEIGSKEAIKINKDKDSMSESAWGDEDKSQLKKDCFLCSNWKTVVKSVFQKLEDGWEDGKEGSLGYPVMEKKGDEVVYNRAGLASAKAYAEKNNETEVLSKLKEIYKHLDLSWDNEEIKNRKKEGEGMEEKVEFSLNSSQMFDAIGSAIGGIKYMNGDYECRKYYPEAYDESYVFLCDCEEGKTFKFPYVLNDNLITINFDEKVEVIRGGYEEVGKQEHEEHEELENSQNVDETVEELKNKCSDTETKFAELEEKYKAMETELTDCKNDLSKYKRDEELSEMTNMLNEFSHCFAEDELTAMNSKMSDMTKEEFTKEIDNKAIEYAKKKKETKSEEEIKNSYQVSFSNFPLGDHFNFGTTNKTNDLDSIIEKSDVKIKFK